MGDNKRDTAVIVLLAALSAVLHGWLARAGDLRAQLPAFFVVHVFLVGLMLLAWGRLRRHGRALPLAVGAALLFRLIAAASDAPGLSDDVYRYVWDGRVQLHGIHPYPFAPLDPRLAELRDDDWSRINHPELKTIYPPLAQACFLGLAAMGAGPTGFRFALGLADFGVVLVLGLLLRRLALPPERVILYAWNPLAILETAGNAHIEPLGVLLLMLAGMWIIDRRPTLSTLALAGSIQVKLLPLVLFPGYLRRLRTRHVLLLVVALVIPCAVYGWSGPLLGGGLSDYALRWERNAFVFAGVRRLMEWLDSGALLKPVIFWLQQRVPGNWIPWDLFYRHVWPASVARIVVSVAGIAWLLHLTFKQRLDAARESFLALGGILLLAPTLHPWYVLWVLPWAAAFLSPGWLVLGMLVPLAYCGAPGDVPWVLRGLEYGLPLAFVGWSRLRRALC